VKIRWSQRSLRDLREIGAFIRRDNPPAAYRWVHQLQERDHKAATMPKSGRVVPELGLDDVREVFLGNYRSVYRLSAQGIEILTVLEGHRLLPIRPRED
jgi:toxin ParE1/3/4